MINRLNVVFRGSRTTARFPSHLWGLACVAASVDDDYLKSFILSEISLVDSSFRGSASDFVREFLISIISSNLERNPPLLLRELSL